MASIPLYNPSAPDYINAPPAVPVEITVVGTGATIPLQDAPVPDQIPVGDGNLPPLPVAPALPVPGISNGMVAILLIALAVFLAVKVL